MLTLHNAKNRVDEYDEPEIKKGTYRAQTGRSLNELQGLTAERLFMPSDFNADGSLKFGIPSQSGVGGTDLKPGDIKYVDMEWGWCYHRRRCWLLGATAQYSGNSEPSALRV